MCRNGVFFFFFIFSFSRRQWAAERPGCRRVGALTGVQSGAQISRLTGNRPVVVIKELWVPWGSRSPWRYCVFWALWTSRNISPLIFAFKPTYWQYKYKNTVSYICVYINCIRSRRIHERCLPWWADAASFLCLLSDLQGRVECIMLTSCF